MKKNVFGIVLIIVGIGIISSALFMRYSAERKQKIMIESFQKTLFEIENNESGEQDSDVIDTNLQDNISENGIILPSDKPNLQNIKTMGIMVIPKINLNVAIAEGTDNGTLKFAVGHFEGTAMPGEKGNFSVAGHRSYTYNKYFNRLDELKIGDEIQVSTKKGKFTYEVFEIMVVEPTEVSVLDPTENPTITLVTCTPIRSATHRLIVKGKLRA